MEVSLEQASRHTHLHGATDGRLIGRTGPGPRAAGRPPPSRVLDAGAYHDVSASLCAPKWMLDDQVALCALERNTAEGPIFAAKLFDGQRAAAVNATSDRLRPRALPLSTCVLATLVAPLCLRLWVGVALDETDPPPERQTKCRSAPSGSHRLKMGTQLKYFVILNHQQGFLSCARFFW